MSLTQYVEEGADACLGKWGDYNSNSCGGESPTQNDVDTNLKQANANAAKKIAALDHQNFQSVSE